MLTRTTVLCVLLAGPLLAATPDLPAPPRPASHTLAKGETLWTVAVRYGLSVKSIKDANRFADAAHLAPGTLVKLPGQSAYTLGEETAEFKQVSFVQPDAPKAALPPPAPATAAATDDDEDGIVVPQKCAPARRLAPRSSSTGFIWPVDGDVISPFGNRRRRHRHAGVDLKAPRGTPIVAARDGWVVFSGVVRGHGRVVVLEHEDGYHTVYAHNSKNLVSPEKDGDRLIKAGERIAILGSSGNATCAHVHFEIRSDGQPVDPMGFLPAN